MPLGIGQRDLLPSLARKRRNRLLGQCLPLLRAQIHSAVFLRILLAGLLLKRPPPPPVPAPPLPPPLSLDYVPSRCVRSHPRRIDGHVSQLPHPRPPRHLHHLREHVVDRPSVPPQKLAQRLVVRPQSPRQIAKRQVLVDPPLQPPCRVHSQAKSIEPHLQHHARRVGQLPFCCIGLLELAEIELLHHGMQPET